MSKKFISIQQAADMSGKSIQTIRRGIKSKKFKFKKQKTPQGFNYLVDSESFCTAYNIKVTTPQDAIKETSSESNSTTKKQKTNKKAETTDVSTENFITLDHLKEFTNTLDKMMKQHSEERQNFVRLIGTLQEKIFVLENQVNILQAPKKKWFELWK